MPLINIMSTSNPRVMNTMITENPKMRSMIIANQMMMTMNATYTIHYIHPPSKFLRGRVVQPLKVPRYRTLPIQNDDTEVF